MHAKDEPNAQRQGSLLHAVFFCALWPDHSRPLQYLKHKHVTPSWDRSHQHRVQHLVVLLALGRAHVDNFPLQVVRQVLDALECDLKLEGVVEGRWVVQDDHVQHLYFGHGE